MRYRPLSHAAPMLTLMVMSTTTWGSVRQAEGACSVEPSSLVCAMDDAKADSLMSSEPAAEQGAGQDESRPRELVVSREHFRGPVQRSVVRAAQSLLDLPLGAEVVLNVEGTPYGFRLEPHYHPPGYEGGPIGWHKGVTLYHVMERSAN